MALKPRASVGPLTIWYGGAGSGGRNTRKAEHELRRDEAAVSINGWIPAAKSFAKRPGNNALLPMGPTGTGNVANGLAVVRFNDVSCVIVQTQNTLQAAQVTDSVYATIAASVTPTARGLFAANAYSTVSGADAAFICNGVDPPQKWLGPGNSTVSLTTSSAPANHAGTAVITPAFVCTFFNSLWYAGEPTEPTAVYISDPTQPESFTYGGNLPGSSYLPFLIGHNDGVAGGKVTGILPIGASSMMVYKESAIYRMDHIGYYGDIGPWDVNLVSPSIGCTAPKSIVSFDSFHAFLSIDGVYTTDGGTVSKRPISDNNPDLFEGANSAIVDNTTAVGARYGQRYLLFYDNGGL